MKTLSDSQYSVFLSALQGAPLRDQCIFLFMLQCGMRVGEVCALQVSDVSLSGKPFHTIGIRNGHSRIKSLRYVPLTPLLVDRLTSFLSERKSLIKTGPDIGALFVSRIGKTPLLPRDVQRLLKAFCLSALGEPFHPHSLRHTFGTRLLKVSNIRVVQQLLGHAALSSTMVYTHPSEDDRRSAIESAF